MASELIDAKLGCDGVEILPERIMQVETIGKTSGMGVGAAFTWNTHRIVPRQRRRCSELGEDTCGLTGDNVGTTECGEIDGGDELTGIGGARGVAGEVDDITA